MQNMQRLFELSKDLICVAGLDGYFKEINPAFCEVLGYTVSELTGVPFLDLVHPADRAATLSRLENLRDGRDVLHFENRYRCKDGSIKWLAWVAIPELEEECIYAVARDVTGTRQSLDELLGDLPGMVYRCTNDAEWTMNFVSKGCLPLTGYSTEELVDRKTMTYARIIHPEDRDRIRQEVQQAVDDGREFELEYRITTADGRVKQVWERGRALNDHHGRVESLQGCVFDITERRKLENELNQLQRMESLGQLTGGVAHDFNNLLTVMTGNLELLEERLAHDEESLELVRDASESARRGAELCQRLLAFGRRQALSPEETGINTLVGRVEKLIRRTISDGIRVQMSLDADLPNVLIDQGQLENAILNLVINARDAMPDGGTIFIRTDLFHAGLAYAQAHPDVAAGEYVMIEVGDTGSGMPPEVRDRAIEPFFTTKAKGKGTGLGLSMVYGLLKQSGGHVRIYSEPGHGTSVKLFVPAIAGSDLRLATVSLMSGGLMPGGTEQILVVDDDAGVRKLVAGTLAALGYGVIEAESGATALEWLTRAGSDIDLLLTDVVMPGGVDGVALADLARKSSPGLKVLMTSGFSTDQLGGRQPYGVLTKPYHNKELAAAVRGTLDS